MGPLAIETIGLTRHFAGRAAVDDLTLTIPAGKVFGFLGPNGAGKTTTVRMLTALIAPLGGTACVAGYRLGENDEALRRAVGILTETPGLYDRLSARQNLTFFAQLYDLDSRKAAMQTERYLRTLELWGRRDDPVGGFSRGMRQKLAIARALLHEPEVVFLDEPTVGLDPEASKIVRDFVRELRAEGRTIFLTTHNLADADELCDLIGIFQGRLLHLDTPAGLRAELFGEGTRITLAGDAAPWVPTTEALSFVRSAAATGDLLTVALDAPDDQNPTLVAALVATGAPVRYVTPQEHTLEEVYLQLLGNARETRQLVGAGR
ncbi:MAG: Efflux ABC transporter, ATP-binding protein [uncultured Thermomicrobiales bacterium]|uniref:Efflux ABC transporter, ATP-binding protein n=1 Tax=uncultured Thermomicrobiales bacterium TaxID=1645740 RepID=A0A6J4VX32_9BACT|nr:MAG: Efflux ABC transporter, ATP-binding protein [uncultured Thermomicrobiales bacterium]